MQASLVVGRSNIVGWLIAVGCLLPAPAPAASPPEDSRALTWEIEVLPTLQTPFGELVNVIGRDLNEKGEVAGTVRGGLFPSAAFRYTPGVGMKDLDPRGRYRSETTIRGAINEHGDVFGHERDLRRRSARIFVYRDEGGFDFLKKGRTPDIRRHFGIFGGQMFLPDAGHFCGFVRTDDPNLGRVIRPYLYVPGEGWTNLTSLHPRFKSETGVFCKYVTQKGDLVLSVSGPPDPGEEPPFGHQETYVVTDGKVSALPTFGRLVNTTNPPNEAFVHPGVYIDGPGKERAYVWSPDQGGTELQPTGEESAALQVNESSLVAGVMGPFNQSDRVFTYSEGGGLRVVIRRADFERLLEPYGLDIKSVYVYDMNNHGAIVGEITTGQSDGGFPYYYSRQTGLVDLKAVVESFDVDFRLFDGVGAWVIEVNDRGDILMVGRGTQPYLRLSTAILSLRSG